MTDSELKVIVNVEAAIVNDGRYLMIVRGEEETHAPGTLSLPGGKVDADEQHEDILEHAVRREVSEEVGLDLEDDITYVTSSFFVSDSGQPVINIVFLCRYRSGTPAIRDVGEVAALSWRSVEDVLRDPQSPPWTRRSVEAAERKRIALYPQSS